MTGRVESKNPQPVLTLRDELDRDRGDGFRLSWGTQDAAGRFPTRGRGARLLGTPPFLVLFKVGNLHHGYQAVFTTA